MPNCDSTTIGKHQLSHTQVHFIHALNNHPTIALTKPSRTSKHQIFFFFVLIGKLQNKKEVEENRRM